MAGEKGRLSTFGRRMVAMGKRSAADLDDAASSLVTDAQAAARLRGYLRDPNVSALTIERTRDWLDRWGWILLFSGLAFTTVNVALFVGGWTGWLVEPLVMGAMLVLLRGEQIANRFGEKSGRWVKGTRWAALLITYVMNTGAFYGARDLKGIFIHSVPVILVAALAEALVQQRQTLTTVADRMGMPVEEPVEAAESPAETPQDEPEGDEPTDELVPPRNHVDYAFDAYVELRDEAVERGLDVDAIGPAQVDRKAGVPVGTSKRPGRMARFAEQYAQLKEVSDGDDADTGADLGSESA